MALIILRIPDSVIGKTRLPDVYLFLLAKPVGKPSLDELNGTLQRNRRRRRQQSVNVVRHDDEFMQQIFSLLAIVKHRVNQQSRPRIVTKNGSSLPCDGSDKERAFGVHVWMVAAQPTDQS